MGALYRYQGAKRSPSGSCRSSTSETKHRRRAAAGATKGSNKSILIPAIDRAIALTTPPLPPPRATCCSERPLGVRPIRRRARRRDHDFGVVFSLTCCSRPAQSNRSPLPTGPARWRKLPPRNGPKMDRICIALDVTGRGRAGKTIANRPIGLGPTSGLNNEPTSSSIGSTGSPRTCCSESGQLRRFARLAFERAN